MKALLKALAAVLVKVLPGLLDRWLRPDRDPSAVGRRVLSDVECGKASQASVALREIGRSKDPAERRRRLVEWARKHPP